MQRVIKVEEKLRFLKDLLTGEKDLNSLRPPQHYIFYKNQDGLYSIPNSDLLCDEQMLESWIKANARKCDSVIMFVPCEGCEPLVEDNVIVWKEKKTYADDSTVAVETLDTEYTELDSTPLETEVDVNHGSQTKCRNKPVIEPQEAFRPIGLIPARLIRAGKLSQYGLTWGSICEY